MTGELNSYQYMVQYVPNIAMWHDIPQKGLNIKLVAVQAPSIYVHIHTYILAYTYICISICASSKAWRKGSSTAWAQAAACQVAEAITTPTRSCIFPTELYMYKYKYIHICMNKCMYIHIYGFPHFPERPPNKANVWIEEPAGKASSHTAPANPDSGRQELQPRGLTQTASRSYTDISYPGSHVYHKSTP